MIEIGKFAQEMLQRTDLSPAERKAVESVTLQSESWVTRANELVSPVDQAIVTEQPAAKTLKTPKVFEMPANVYVIRRPVEGLTIPSSDQLVATARAELKSHFGKDFEVPEPPIEVSQRLSILAERGIRGFEVYYLPGLKLEKGDKFWKGQGKVRPEDYFWNQIRNGNYPSQVAVLDEGWYIGDGRVKPSYNNGQQVYEDDYLAPLMEALRAAGKIETYGNVPNNSRFGASPREIEGVILPTFAQMSGALGEVRNRKYIEFNIRGNMAHPECGQTDTWEWFSDPVFQGASRFIGGGSGCGGLAHVDRYSVGHRDDDVGFSPVERFPSKP